MALKRLPEKLERIALALERIIPQPLQKTEEKRLDGWISVDTALPDYGLNVIVMVYWMGEMRIFNSKRYVVDDNEVIPNNLDPNHFFVEDERQKVRFWMYIPVLPNGGK